MKKLFKRYFALALILVTGIVLGAPSNFSTNRQNSKVVLSQTGMEFTSDGTPNGDKVMQINSGGNVVIFNALKMLKGSGAFNLEVLTGVNIGLPMTADIPVLTPTAFLPGVGLFKIMITKGRQFFMGEPGQNTQMYLANSTGDIGWKLDSDDSQARFILQPFTGGAMNGLMGYTQFNVNGTIQAGNTGIITAINNGTAETYVTKGYISGLNAGFVTLGTNQTITGTKTFEGTTYMNSAFIYRLGWMGSTNSGFSVDENGIEYAGFTCSDFGPKSLMSKDCITALVTGYNTNLTNTYVPYRSGDRFYNSNTIFNYNLGRLELGGRSGVINYSGVAMIASGGAYFDGDGILGGFSIPIGSGVGMFGWASGTGRAAGYLQTSSNAYGLRVDSNSRGDAAAINVDTLFGLGVEIDTLDATGISINKLFSNYTGVSTALVIGYSGFSNMSVDYTGNISTNGDVQIMGWQYFGTGWRQGLSGNNFVTQAFTGGVWVEKASLTP